MAEKLIDAATKFVDDFAAYQPLQTARRNSYNAMWKFASFNEDYTEENHRDDEGLLHVMIYFDNDKSDYENLMDGADAYIAKYGEWQEAVKALEEATKNREDAIQRMQETSLAYNRATVNRTQANAELQAAKDDLEIAQERVNVAEIANDVLEQALNDAEEELDNAKAAYDRAMDVTVDKVRAGAITDDEYAYLNSYKDLYDVAKADYDEAKAAYCDALAAYNVSFMNYLKEWRAAHPIELHVREAVDRYFYSQDGDSTSDAGIIRR